MIRDEWPHIFFLSCRPKLGGSQQETATFCGILRPCLKLTARKNPEHRCLEDDSLPCGATSGFFTLVPGSVSLSLDTLENDFASATFFLKNQAVLIFFGCSNTCIGSTPPPSIPVANEGLHGSATRNVMILVVTVIGLWGGGSNPCVLF